jgi:hypothetical protein
VLLFSQKHRYSPDALVFALRLLYVSRAAYSLVRDRILVLPHISYLRKLSSIFNVNLDTHDAGHVVVNFRVFLSCMRKWKFQILNQNLWFSYIARYVGYKLVTNKVDCELCKGELITCQQLQVDLPLDQTSYIADLDRGGLKWPTDLLAEAVTQMFFGFSVCDFVNV